MPLVQPILILYFVSPDYHLSFTGESSDYQLRFYNWVNVSGSKKLLC